MSSLTTAGSMSLSNGERSVSVEDFATTHLSLGIAGGGAGGSRPQQQGRRRRTVQLFGEVLVVQDDDDGHGGARHREPATAAAPASRRKRDHGGSSSNVAAAAASGQRNKKARKLHDTDGGGGDRGSPASDGGGGGGKKLRLTAAQAAMLEDSFRAHNILAHAEKQELARRVGLSARQVEVWFQNRRARTKLKQTEIDCELLRRWCDRLADENARLRRDLAELRASAAVCAVCCDKHAAVAGAEMATAN